MRLISWTHHRGIEQYYFAESATRGTSLALPKSLIFLASKVSKCLPVGPIRSLALLAFL
jgi:hypothetical protein